MALPPKRRLQLYQIFLVTFFWMLCAVFFALYKCVNYDPVTREFIFLVPQGFSLTAFVLVNLIGPTFGGLVGGSILVLFISEKLRDKSYATFLLVSFIFFLGFIIFLNTAVSYYFYYQEVIFSSEIPWKTALEALMGPYALRNIATWMVIVFLTLHGLRMYERYGPGTYIPLLLGRYHRPREVERIFMFLDISDATTIAEQLGHRRFFSLLKDFYSDIADPILNCRGEIYQYVGDEITVSWPKPCGAKEGMRSLDCFFLIEEVMGRMTDKYQQKYGFIPSFKAALHFGSVIVGEMGVVKREIVYSGDLLNTAARIMEQCKHYKQKLIVSQEVVDVMPPEMSARYRLTLLGNLVLRGKKHSIRLFGITRLGKNLKEVRFQIAPI